MKKLSGLHQSGGQLLFTALLILPVMAGAQTLPGNQIWLADIQSGLPEELSLIIDNGRYNNQPMFSPDGKTIFFTAEQEDEQTDVAAYLIADGEITIVKHSAESEYSPTPVPGKQAVSVIRVEPPEQLQRLWSIPLDGGEATLLMPNAEPVGYHTWLDDQTTAVFILGETFTLQLAAVGDSPPVFLSDNIGRTLRKDPQSREIIFVDKNAEPWTIRSFNLESRQSTLIQALLPGIEDFEVESDDTFWMGSGSKLYTSQPKTRSWTLAADLKEFGIEDITRLASSPDGRYLAIVGSR